MSALTGLKGTAAACLARVTAGVSAVKAYGPSVAYAGVAAFLSVDAAERVAKAVIPEVAKVATGMLVASGQYAYGLLNGAEGYLNETPWIHGSIATGAVALLTLAGAVEASRRAINALPIKIKEE